MLFSMFVYITRTILLLLVACSASAQPLKIIASIYPVKLIAQEVIGDRHSLEVLLSAGQSPHDFAFKVSERRKLANADLLLWVGPELEPYLTGISSDQSSLSMVSTAAIRSTDVQLGDHDVGAGLLNKQRTTSHKHDHSRDQHLWLSFEQARQFALSIMQRLVQLDPAGENTYRKNVRTFLSRLEPLSQVSQQLIQTQSRSSVSRPYAVAHRAYGHFLESFQFPEPVVLSNSPELSPGARSLWQIGNQLDDHSCLLVEGSNPQHWLTTFAERNQLQVVSVDIMGDLTGVTTYTELISAMLKVFADCSSLEQGKFEQKKSLH